MGEWLKNVWRKLGVVRVEVGPSYWLVAIIRPATGEVVALLPVLASSAAEAITRLGDQWGHDGQYHAAAWASAASVPVVISGGSRSREAAASALAAVQAAAANPGGTPHEVDGHTPPANHTRQKIVALKGQRRRK